MEGDINHTRHVLGDDTALTMQQRLGRAAEQIHAPRSDQAATSAALRREQLRVFDDAADYLLDAATRPDHESGGAFGRIVLPPRTGKTVIAAHLVARAGLTAVFIVPTRVLVEQVADELARHLPSVPVGRYFGEASEVVEGGVNVVTYAMLHSRASALPSAIRRAALVIADEAHHAMTPPRVRLLHDAFDPRAVRIALTATPDYDDDRVLARHFPVLIHELTLEEAMRLELIAPARLWVAEVDADGSAVRIIAGDFDAEVLGKVMSTAPFFRAVELYRNHPRHAATPALVACSSRQQAHALVAYLVERGHGDTIGLVLGDTSRHERTEILRRFESGDLDTLVQVGVLVEGWSSPRCKLLLDLAPSLSRVRATQKYFRALTRMGDAEAAIYVFLPADLPQLPVLPTELFGRSSEYPCGELLTAQDDSASGTATVHRDPLPSIAGVRLRHRIALSTLVEAPKLDVHDDVGLRAVVLSCHAFDPRRPCSLLRFRWMAFRHELFTGRGDSLLRWLGIAARRLPYCELLDRIVPGLGARRFLIDQRSDMPEESTGSSPDARTWLERAALVGQGRFGRDDAFAAAWRTATGAPVDPVPSADESILHREIVATLRRAVWTLRARERRALWLRFGMFGHSEHTLDAVGEDMNFTRERARQLLEQALAKLRRKLRPWMRTLTGRDPWEPTFPSPGPRAFAAYLSTRSWPAHDRSTCDPPVVASRRPTAPAALAIESSPAVPADTPGRQRSDRRRRG